MIRIARVDIHRVEMMRMVRLAALLDSPTAFSSIHAREASFTDEQWLARAKAADGIAAINFLAIDGDHGCGIVRGQMDDKDLSVAWVGSMWVAPTHRRGGVGKMLIDAVVNWAIDRGFATLKLEVVETNSAAIAFYDRMGFARTGRTFPYPNAPNLLEHEMARGLP